MEKHDDGVAGVKGMVRILPGVDAAAGLRVCLGNESLYRRLLMRFIKGESDFVARFAVALDAADPQAARRCAHSLTGSAGNLGIRGVQMAAAELENACRDQCARDEITTLLAAVADELATVLAGLREAGVEGGGMEGSA